MKVQIGIFECTGIMGQDLVHPYIQSTTVLCDIATLYNILYILSYLHVYLACDSVFNKQQKINIKTTVLL